MAETHPGDLNKKNNEASKAVGTNWIPQPYLKASVAFHPAGYRKNEKACRGRRCDRLSENNRTATGRRSVAVPTNVPGRRSRTFAYRRNAGGDAFLR
jgi:hypothetical protein